jgi:hypothetical protein
VKTYVVIGMSKGNLAANLVTAWRILDALKVVTALENPTANLVTAWQTLSCS